MGTQRLDKNRDLFFALIKKQWENQKTRERITASEATWRILSPPIVEKNLKWKRMLMMMMLMMMLMMMMLMMS